MEKDRNTTGNRRRKKSVLLIVMLVLVSLIIITWIALPAIILRYSNNTLQNLEEYTGKVEDIDIRLLRGSVIIREIMLDKLDEDGKHDTTPLVSIDRIEASINWPSLFKGKISGKMLVESPVIIYTSEVHMDKEIKKDTMDFREILRKLVPISINSFEVRRGQIHFVDPNAKPVIDVYLSNLYINATNLTNVESNNPLPARVSAVAGMYEGDLIIDVRLDPLNKTPTFEMETELTSMELTELNPFFKEYGNFEVQNGRFSMYSEFAGKEGRFGGYVKPFIEDFEIEEQKEGEEVDQKIWESIVGSAMKILENPKTEAVATRIPVEGEFTNANVDAWEAIHYVLRNAFVEALRPTIENSISLNRMQPKNKETFLEKIFGGNDNEKQKSDGKEENKKKE